MSTICPICKAENCKGKAEGSLSIYECIKCGKYKMDIMIVQQNILGDNFHKVSSWVSEQNKVFDEVPIFTIEKIEQILRQRDKTIREKFDAYIKTFYQYKSLPNMRDLNQFNHCYIFDQQEMNRIVSKIMENNYTTYYGDYYTLSFDGIEYAEQLDAPNQNSNKIFMAFWFDLEIQSIFDDIVKPAIDEVGFLAERVSSSTTNLENKISDEIIGMIKSSRAVIADCTGNRTAVYYEAGYAMGMKIPVIWTCKADQVGDICFDVSQHPFILWSTPEDLAEKVVKRLKAIL